MIRRAHRIMGAWFGISTLIAVVVALLLGCSGAYQGTTHVPVYERIEKSMVAEFNEMESSYRRSAQSGLSKSALVKLANDMAAYASRTVSRRRESARSARAEANKATKDLREAQQLQSNGSVAETFLSYTSVGLSVEIQKKAVSKAVFMERSVNFWASKARIWETTAAGLNVELAR